jgi:alpha-L-fucosidase 2
VNLLPEVAGLRYVLDGLLRLPGGLTTTAMTSRWTRLRGELPDFSMRTLNGQTVLSPGSVLGPKNNTETPELYAVYPYRQYGVGRPELELARQTYTQRLDKQTRGWAQDPIFAAMTGFTNDAAAQVVSRFGTKHADSRFPAMWGPNHDWIPDQCHGAVSMIALQQMLVQTVGNRILLFPAWPPDWDVQFKLHLPGNTSMTGELRDGEVTHFTIQPSSRRQDVETHIGTLPPATGLMVRVD